MSPLPEFLIVGAMKSATSTLHEQLAVQHGVFMSSPKEPCFFSDDAQWNRGLDWYRSLFAEAAADDLCGESSTHYTKLPTYPKTVQRIAETLSGDIRIIYMMRHPIDRLVSQYIHEWSQDVIPARMTVDEMIERYPQFADYGRYAYQLQPYIDVFGCEQILPMFFERFIADGEAELKRVGRFLHLPGPVRWFDDVQQRNVSRERIRRSPWRNMLLNSSGLRAIVRNTLPQSWRDRVKTSWSMQQRPELSPAVRGMLETMYDEDLAQLGRWLGLELNCANFKDVAQQTVPTWTQAKAGAAT